MVSKSRRVGVWGSVMVIGALVSAAGAQPNSSVKLEGSGDHRAESNAMQLKPFDASVLTSLSNWSGTAVTADNTKEKVVLLMTWAGWNKNTFGAVRVAEALNKKYADKGLVVVGIHSPRDFAKAADAAKELGVTFAYAADEQGKARAALKVDGDPDFYLVDRAGNMRFADIETTGVEQAVEMLIAETAEKAAAVPDSVKMASKTKMVEAGKTGDTKGLVKPGQPLTVTFPDPPEEVYAAASWPNFVDTTGFSEYDTLAKKLKKEKPVVELPDEGWAAGTKPVTRGRITVIYLFDPLEQDHLSQIPLMNRAQDAWRRDVVVIGMPLPTPDKRNRLSTEDEKTKYDQDVLKAARSLVNAREINHSILGSSTFMPAGIDRWYVYLTSMREFGVVMLISTDNKIRWYGNPHMEGFRTALDEMVRADPGVKARQRAEEAKAKTENQ